MLPINPTQIPALYKQALGLQQKGKSNEAVKIYDTILTTNPKIAEAHFQKGQIFLHALQFESATKSFSNAVKLKPKEPAIWQAYCEALIRFANPQATSAALKILTSSGLPTQTQKAIADRLKSPRTKTKVDAGSARPADLNAIVSFLNAGKFSEAEKKTQSLLRTNGTSPVLWNMLAAAQEGLGKANDTKASYKKAIQLKPDYAEAHLNYGRFLLAIGDISNALTSLEQARSLTPNAPAVLLQLAKAYHRREKLDEAHNLITRAATLDAKNADIFLTSAQIETQRHDHDLALKSLERAETLGDVSQTLFVLRAKAQSALGRESDALESIEQAIQIAPQNIAALAAKASILQSHGDFDAATQVFEYMFDLAPLAGEHFRTYSASHKFTADDPVLTRMEAAYADPALTDAQRMQFCFALSKAMEDLKDYDRAFPYLSEANTLMRASHPYDIETRRVEIDMFKKAFSDFDTNTPADDNASNYAPIFVTGMPRSGTTLIEQILASHSTVEGAGEVGWLPRKGYETLIPRDGSTRLLSDIADSDLRKIAVEYEQVMKTLLPGSQKATDKSIQTYLMMALVWRALPNAKIIVVRRDPRDNLLSIYRNLFPEGTHLYSYDLHDLGQYYRMFDEMINFWREIAPDRFYEVWYDDLIANPEEESRKLVAAAGLTWEDNCLNFHQNKRRVDTLSVYQVRQPIYKSSLKAWQRYENELKPLFESLGDLCEPPKRD